MVGTTDTVPAMLTPGEFVIKQESAAMLGEPLLRKLNAISDNAPQGYQAGNGVSQNIGAHGNIDALIGQAQLENMMENVVPGYQEGGGVGEAEQALPDWSKIKPNSLLRLFSEKNQHIFPTELESSIYDRDEAVSDSLDEAGLDWMSDEFDIEHSKAMNGMTASNYDDVRLFLQDMAKKKRKNTLTDTEKEDVSSAIKDLTPAIRRFFSENPDMFKSAPEGTTRAKGDYEAQEISPELPLTRGYNRTLGSAFRKVLPGFYENGGDVEGYPEGEWEEKFKSNLKNPSWEEYGMGEYATREKPGRYQDPIHKYISDMILAGRQDMLGGLLDDDYYKPLVEQELRFMNLQKLVQSAEDTIPSYSGKKEGIDIGDIFGEQSLLKQRGKKKSISDYKYDLGETILGQRINELYANNLYGLDNSTKGFQEGGGVGEAGRKYPPGTLMSPFMGDKVSPQDKTATTPFQSPEQAAEFERMIKMLQIQEILKKAKESQTYDAEMIESDGKSILPPWQGKRNFKGNLYEDNIEFPVAREGYLQR